MVALFGSIHETKGLRVLHVHVYVDKDSYNTILSKTGSIIQTVAEVEQIRDLLGDVVARRIERYLWTRYIMYCKIITVDKFRTHEILLCSSEPETLNQWAECLKRDNYIMKL